MILARQDVYERGRGMKVFQNESDLCFKMIGIETIPIIQAAS